jgi:hypothetical protein
MNTSSVYRNIRIAMFVFVVLAASKTFASHTDYYLEIKDEKGKVTKVKVASDGKFTTPPLPAGTYECTFFTTGVGRGISSPMGGSERRGIVSPTGGVVDRESSAPAKLSFTYEVKSPRDVATGQASGKRTHKPLTITKEWGPSTPQLRFEKIVIDADCDGITGTFACKSADGKTMALDDWTSPSK